jgi:hypothetical protein
MRTPPQSLLPDRMCLVSAAHRLEAQDGHYARCNEPCICPSCATVLCSKRHAMKGAQAGANSLIGYKHQQGEHILALTDNHG